jgi:uncharacterized membrane protein
MTASKSSRARTARAQRAQGSQGVQGGQGAQANARNGTAVKASSTVKAGAAVKASPTAKAGAAVKASPTAKAGVTVKGGSPPRAVATRGGAPDRRGAALARETAEAPDRHGLVPPWLQFLTFGLALAGLGVSIYLTVAHFTETALAGCSENGTINCTKVTTSPQSYVFGIPVAVLGLAFYVVAVALMSPWAWRSARREIHLIRLASLVVGIGFVLYLVYAELFIIGAICLYCTSVHAITFLLFGLTVFAAAAWGLPERQRS